jgi:cellulose synthase/poly-beta-1,6-N-acetylglucosamine synthase-like glycosyltransferase
MNDTVLSVLQTILIIGGLFVIGYFLLGGLFYLLQLSIASREVSRRFRTGRGEDLMRLLSAEFLPRITVLVPAYNESATIEQTVRSLLTLHYPQLEIVVVDDGSTDDTLDRLRVTFELSEVPLPYDTVIPTRPVSAILRSHLHENLLVLSKENGGKSDALNAGLSLASGELVCAVDGDTILHVESLQRLVLPFLADEDTVAAGATIRVANGCTFKDGRVDQEHAPKRFLPAIQTVEYLRSFQFGRMGWNLMGGNIIISGAFGLFRRRAMIHAGGYARTVGEDVEMIIRIRRRQLERGLPGTVVFVPDPIAWTQVPENLRDLGRQRDRWHRGLAEALWRHRAVFGRRRYGSLGMVLLPAFTLIELFAPVVEAFGLALLPLAIYLDAVQWSFALLLLLSAVVFMTFLSTFAVVLEVYTFDRFADGKDWLILCGSAAVENVGYRQLTVLWRLRGLIGFLLGQSHWGERTRKEFDRPEGDEASPGLLVTGTPR